MKTFSKSKIIYIEDYREFNEHLSKLQNRYEYNENNETEHSKIWGYQIKVLPTKIVLKYTENTIIRNYAEYIFYLDDREIIEHKSGMQCYSNLQRMSKSFINSFRQNYNFYSKNGECLLAPIAGLLYINPKHFNKRHNNVYSYDINSSYSWAMLQDMPNTNIEPKYNTMVQNGEVGFIEAVNDFTGNIELKMVTNGFAQWVFPKIKSPFIKFVEYYYNLKVKSKTKQERQKYKDILNYSVGFIRRHNPFIHSAILTHAKERIISLIDENTIYSNTDSIISLTKREDIEIGQNIGDFKVEHEAETFAICQSGYQWNNEIPSIRGKSKNWFKNAYPNGFDILKDELPKAENGNKYKFDEISFKIIKL